MKFKKIYADGSEDGAKYSYILLGIFTVLVYIWRSYLPLVNDDLMYTHGVLPNESFFWNAYGPVISSWRDVWEACCNHWLVVNGRLTNILTFIVLYMPEWVRTVISTLVITATIWMIVICATGRKGMQATWMIGLMLLMIWKLLPWHDHMTSTCYFLNYALPGVMTLCYAELFLSGRKYTSLQMVGISIFVFILGWMHEGFSIPLCITSFLIILINKEQRGQRFLILSILTLGALMVIFAPSTLDRAHREAARDYDIQLAILQIVRYQYAMYLYIIILGAIWWKRGWDKIITQLRQGKFWLLLAFSTLLLCLILKQTGRMFWATDLAFTLLGYRALYDNFAVCRRPLKGLSAGLVILIILFMSGLIYWQKKSRVMYDNIISQITSSGKPIAYGEILFATDVPWYTLGLTSVTDMVNLQYMCCSFLEDKEFKLYNILVLPEEFRGLPYSEWPKIPGRNNMRGGGKMICSTDSIKEFTKVLITYGEETESMNPVKVLMSKMSGKPETREGVVLHVYKCLTEQGDTIYSYEVSCDELTGYRKIKAIDMKE